MVQPETDKKQRVTLLSRSMRAKIFASGVAANIERFARTFWASAVVMLAILGLLLWQVHTLIPAPFDIGFYLILLIGLIAFVVRGIRRFIPARQKDAITRLDAQVAGSPVTSLVDNIYLGANDDASLELWQLHQSRMAKLAQKSQVAAPHVRLSKNDPWALRLIVMLFFCSAVLFGRASSEQSLLVTLQDLASGTTGQTVSYEAWAEPPAYTGFPSIYLNKIEPEKLLQLPEGTEIVLRNYSGIELDIVSELSDLAEDNRKLSTESSFKLSKSGRLVLQSGYKTIAQWDIDMIPDMPPSVTLTNEISRTVQGSIQIPYATSDDYGITSGVVEITLDFDKVDQRYGLSADPETLVPIKFDLPVPFHVDVTDFTETAVENLAEHPWAGLPVKITLSVTDAAGQTGTIEPVFIRMPGKRFFDTLAGALAEQRRDILWNRANVDRAAMILKTLTYLPQDGFPNTRAYLMVRTVIRRIGYTEVQPIADAMQVDMAETLWRAALLLEDGDLSDAAERLKRAQERLSEAMKNGATDEEIAELVDELRKATDEYLRQLAQNAQPQEQQAGNENTQQVSPEMIQEMMDRIQELMEQGRMDEAQALMDQLQQLLENMQVTQGDPQNGEPSENSSEGLQDTLQEQQELADENFQQMQDEFNRNQDGQNQEGEQQGQNQEGQQQGQSGQQPGAQSDLAERQEALRDMMDQQLGNLGTDDSEAGQAARDALREAERQMGKARDNLEQGRGSDALDNQADAVEALRNGMRQLNEANQQDARGQSREGQQNSETVGPDGQDPLGRSTKNPRNAQTNKRLLQSSEQLQRSKDILKEIRRRTGERERPQQELDYLERLLDRF